MSRRIHFEPDAYYHLYNHAVGNDDLFRVEENYQFFLKRYTHYTHPILDTFAYCLMPNHFHFLVKIRPYLELEDFFTRKHAALNRKAFIQQPVSNQIGQQLGNWLNSYAKAYNKKYNRRGRLFVEQIRRKRISNLKYLRTLVTYIHLNPVHHGFTSVPDDWPFSSYQRFISKENRLAKHEEVVTLFGGEEAFLAGHREVGIQKLIQRLEPFE